MRICELSVVAMAVVLATALPNYSHAAVTKASSESGSVTGAPATASNGQNESSGALRAEPARTGSLQADATPMPLDQLPAKKSSRPPEPSSRRLLLAQAGPPAPTASDGARGQTLQAVVVTGTRINRANLQLTTPITNVGSDILKSEAPANIADALNTLPQLAVGLTPAAATVGTSGGTNGINALNLLNLGTERTLVLMDGRRMTGFNSTSVVDINTIPQQLIQRVDLVTGGGSADYGSDAVAGVVNFILDTKFKGIKYDAQWGESIYGDGKNEKLEVTYGTQLFGGRGHFIISGQYSNQGLVGDFNTRPWFSSTKVVANPTKNGTPPYLVASNVNLNLASAGGLIINSPVNGGLAGTLFGPGGTPENFQFGSPTGSGGLMFGGTKNDLAGFTPIQSSVDTRDIFSRFSYAVTPNSTFYTELMFSESHDMDPAVYNFELGTLSIASGNPYLPATVQSEMTATGLSHILVGTWNQDLGPITPVDDYKNYHAVVGFDVQLPGTWTLKSYYQYGRTDGINKNDNDIIKANYAQAINAVRDPSTGQIVCANPANGCVPLDILGTGVATQEAIGWATGDSWRKSIEQEHDASITVQGDPFSTWAGPVSLAFGPEVRREEATGRVDTLSTQSAYFSGNFKPVIGAYNVEEFFGEAYVPLARHLPFAQSIDIDAAGRATNYSTSGYVTTWKFGATWRPVHDVMFRASTSRDIRAPNISDLFAVSQFTQTVIDPAHGNVSDTISYLTGGNPDLLPEIARNYGYGVVYSPSSLPGLKASIDWYKVNITGYVTSPLANAQQAVTLCYQGDAEVCPLVTRDATGTITQVRLVGINAGTLSTEGVNFDVGYSTDLSRLYSPLGILSTRLMGSRLQKYFLNTGLSSAEYAGEVGAAAYPHWKLKMPMLYQQGPVTIGLTGRYVGSGVMSMVPPILDNHVPGIFYLDGSLAYRTPIGLEVYFSAYNILNKYPPVAGSVSSLALLSIGTSQGLYDLTGTTFRIGIRGTL